MTTKKLKKSNRQRVPSLKCSGIIFVDCNHYSALLNTHPHNLIFKCHPATFSLLHHPVVMFLQQFIKEVNYIYPRISSKASWTLKNLNIWQRSRMLLIFQCQQTVKYSLTVPLFLSSSVISGVAACITLATGNLSGFLFFFFPSVLQHFACHPQTD